VDQLARRCSSRFPLCVVVSRTWFVVWRWWCGLTGTQMCGRRRPRRLLGPVTVRPFMTYCLRECRQTRCRQQTWTARSVACLHNIISGSSFRGCCRGLRTPTDCKMNFFAQLQKLKTVNPLWNVEIIWFFNPQNAPKPHFPVALPCGPHCISLQHSPRPLTT